mmetsp:Transcript_77748/g.154468  ORF Transcript_77748/g.154468 Transcript_77748/m.154468 type:complete len:309 (+) Transcript_77748:372-1298(+)
MPGTMPFFGLPVPLVGAAVAGAEEEAAGAACGGAAAAGLAGTGFGGGAGAPPVASRTTCSSSASPSRFRMKPATAAPTPSGVTPLYLATPQRAATSRSSSGTIPLSGSAQLEQKAAFACGIEKRHRCSAPAPSVMAMSLKSSAFSSSLIHGSSSSVSVPPEASSHQSSSRCLSMASVDCTSGATSVVVRNSAALSRRASGRILSLSSAVRQPGRGTTSIFSAPSAAWPSPCFTLISPDLGLARWKAIRTSIVRNSCSSSTVSLPFDSVKCSVIVSKPYSFVGRSHSMQKSWNSSMSMSVAEPSSEPAA